MGSCLISRTTQGTQSLRRWLLKLGRKGGHHLLVVEVVVLVSTLPGLVAARIQGPTIIANIPSSTPKALQKPAPPHGGPPAEDFGRFGLLGEAP